MESDGGTMDPVVKPKVPLQDQLFFEPDFVWGARHWIRCYLNTSNEPRIL
jgi:hypothetical protein